MYPYLFYYIFAIIALFSFLFDCLKIGDKKLYLRLYNTTIIILAFLVAFRYGVGTDTPGYMLSFDVVPSLSKIRWSDIIASRAMPGYTLLVSFIKTLSLDFVYLQIIQAILFFSSFYLLLKRLDLRKFYLLLAFYGFSYFAELSGLRECLGLSFCYFALLYYLDHNYKKYYMLVTIGLMFHTGMFVFFIVPLVRFLKMRRTLKIIFLLLLFAIVVLGLPYIRYYVSVIDDGSVNRYAFSEGKGFSIESLVVSIIYLFIIYKYCIKGKIQPQQMDFVYLGIISVFVSLLSNYVPILYRYTSHFSIFFFYTVHLAFKNMKKQELLSLLLAFIFFYTPSSRFLSIMKGDNIYYCSVFSEDKSYYKHILNTSRLNDLYLPQ